MINDATTIEQRLKIYSEKQIPIHITLKDKEWLNGFVKEIGSDFIILSEFKKGDTPIFFIEILYLETYTEVQK